MSDYKIDIARSGAYQFDEESVIILYAAIAEFISVNQKIEIVLEGKETIETKSAEEALDDAYVRSNLILSIKIGGMGARRESGGYDSASLRIESSFGSTVSLSLSGPRDKCAVARGEVDRVLKSCATWYSRILEVGLGFNIFLLVAAPVCVGLIWALVLYWSHVLSRPWEVPLQWFCGAVWFNLIWSFVKPRAFPKLLFDVGRSSKVGERAKSWRNIAGVGFILAVVAGLVSTFIYEHLR